MSDTEASLDFRFQRLLGARVAPQQSPVLQTTFFNVSLTRQGCNFAATSSQSLRATILSGLKALQMVSAWVDELSVCLGQIATDQKSNEITAVPLLWR